MAQKMLSGYDVGQDARENGEEDRHVISCDAQRRCSAAGRARRARTVGWNTLLARAFLILASQPEVLLPGQFKPLTLLIVFALVVIGWGRSVGRGVFGGDL